MRYTAQISRTIATEGKGNSFVEALRAASLPIPKKPLWVVKAWNEEDESKYYNSPRSTASSASFSFTVEADSPEEAARIVWTRYFGGDTALFDSPK